jgi:hypothetical protein
MKKLFAIITFCICLTFLSGCDNIKLPFNINTDQKDTDDKSSTDSNSIEKSSSENSKTDSNQTTSYTIKDYYPFKENIQYDFEGTGNEYASYKVWVDYIKEARIQLRKNNGGTEVVSVIENKNGELKIIFSKEEAYYREDFTSKPSNTSEVLLKEPLVKGTTWTLTDGRKRYISNVNVNVTTPAGSFKALEVTTEGSNLKNLDYYALNAGLVKTVYTADGLEVTSVLKALKNNSPLTQNVKFYYPSATDEKIYFTQKKLTFKTNDLTKLTFEKLFKEAPNKTVGKLLGPNVRIKSLYLNNDVVYVDFTKELITEMNAGSNYEGMILQSIVNTLGGYYNANKVYITVEDKPYESGHILMKKGQTFTVNTKNTIQLKAN